MIKIENVDTYGWESAIRGMRNPMNSWPKSDSVFENNKIILGENDLDLMKRLGKAGTEHSKYRRMIVVTCDITAPLYFWKEADTYKIGTVANSCSTMHKLASRDLTIEDFSCEHLFPDPLDEDAPMNVLCKIIEVINFHRKAYDKAKRKEDWWQMIQLLPSSFNQRRTIMLNYEVLTNIYRQRKGHKLDEWNDFVAWVETLPYAEELIFLNKVEEGEQK